jgi:hypothetical protein
VVGDHVVTVNETVYHKDDGGVKSVFRIKVINVSPNQKGEGSEKTPSVSTTTTEKETSVEEIIEVDLPSEKTEVPDFTEAAATPNSEIVEDFDNEIPKQVGPDVV